LKNPAVAETITGFRVVVYDSSNSILYNTTETTTTATTLPNSIINQSLNSIEQLNWSDPLLILLNLEFKDSIPVNGKIVITFPTSYISVPSSIANSNT